LNSLKAILQLKSHTGVMMINKILKGMLVKFSKLALTKEQRELAILLKDRDVRLTRNGCGFYEVKK